MTVEKWTRGSDANAAACASTEEPAAIEDGGRPAAFADEFEGVGLTSGGAMDLPKSGTLRSS